MPLTANKSRFPTGFRPLFDDGAVRDDRDVAQLAGLSASLNRKLASCNPGQFFPA
jgi:hypothetical protein